MTASTPAVPQGPLPLIQDWAPALRSLRDSRARCAERIKAICDACRAAHAKAHPVECDPCYAAIVDEIRARYFGGAARATGGDDNGPAAAARTDDSSSSRLENDEWFSGRAAFLRELDQTLDGARERKVSLGAVEARVASEKAAWYRDVLRDYPYFVNVALESSAGGSVPEFHKLLRDPAQSDGALAEVVRAGIGHVRGGGVDVEAYLSATTTPVADNSNDNNNNDGGGDDKKSKIREEVIRLLFETDGPGEIPDGVGPYAELYRSGKLTLPQIADAVDRDRTAGSGTGAERAWRALGERAARRTGARERRHRLDELRRAEAAHRKIQSASSEKRASRLPAAFYELPACRGCGAAAPAGKEVIACSLCQVMLDMGLSAAQTVYCSMECSDKAHRSHIHDTHACSSGPSCLQNTPSPPPPATTLCKECATHFSKATPYCSPACASSALKPHLEKAHPLVWERVKSAGAGADESSAPLLADVASHLVGLGEVYEARIGKKVKGATFV